MSLFTKNEKEGRSYLNTTPKRGWSQTDNPEDVVGLHSKQSEFANTIPHGQASFASGGLDAMRAMYDSIGGKLNKGPDQIFTTTAVQREWENALHGDGNMTHRQAQIQRDMQRRQQANRASLARMRKNKQETGMTLNTGVSQDAPMTFMGSPVMWADSFDDGDKVYMLNPFGVKEPRSIGVISGI